MRPGQWDDMPLKLDTALPIRYRRAAWHLAFQSSPAGCLWVTRICGVPRQEKKQNMHIRSYACPRLEPYMKLMLSALLLRL